MPYLSFIRLETYGCWIFNGISIFFVFIYFFLNSFEGPLISNSKNHFLGGLHHLLLFLMGKESGIGGNLTKLLFSCKDSVEHYVLAPRKKLLLQ